jgi:hypothetical protein
MVQKIPPPPLIASRDQTLNRWLLELTALLNSQGGIDPSNVAGLTALAIQVSTNAANIVFVNGDITLIKAVITTINGEITTINGEITALQANPVVHNGTGAPAGGLGNVHDWYGDVAGAVGARIWIKTGVATWTAFPF